MALTTADLYVLVVDDDPDAREILFEIVDALGIKVSMATDGQEALKIAYQAPPALILLDIMMPHLNGFSVLAKMQGTPAFRNIPVIIVSACTPNQISLFKLPGVVEVVSKGSFSIENMMTLIAKTLGLTSHLAVFTQSAHKQTEVRLAANYLG